MVECTDTTKFPIDGASEPTSTTTRQQQSIEEQNPSIEYQHFSLDGAKQQIKEKLDVKRKIHIFGGAQCRNLASSLLSSRQTSLCNNNKYIVFSTIKPNAPVEEILKNCNSIDDSCNDYMIVCVGENDSDPTYLSIELITILKQFKNINILILNVLKNKYLNEDKLNNMLRNYCKYLPNCTHIDDTKLQYYNFNLSYCNSYLHQICNKINFFIDCNDYKKQYLCKTNNLPMEKYVVENTVSKAKLCTNGKGTIPYYFKHTTNSPVINSPRRQPTSPANTPYKNGIIFQKYPHLLN